MMTMRSAPSADDALDAVRLRALLSADTRDRFAAIDTVDEIDSTNSELLRQRTPQTGIVALFAERQHGGRGRLGRAWASPPGANVYLSLARCFDGGLAALGGLALAVGVAVAETLRGFGADSVAVKWPNDLVADDGDALRKLGGVLIEGGLQEGRARAVIGLGLNLRMPADAGAGIDQPWTDLNALLGGAMPARDAIAAALLEALAEALTRFDTQGLAPFLPRFDALDALRGREVIAEQGDRRLQGVAFGLDADGALRLRLDEGDIALRAGEVRVRRGAIASPHAS